MVHRHHKHGIDGYGQLLGVGKSRRGSEHLMIVLEGIAYLLLVHVAQLHLTLPLWGEGGQEVSLGFP